MSELARVSEARRALAEASTPEEARNVESKAALLAAALAQHDDNLERANEFAEIAVEAAVKVGELIPAGKMGRPKKGAKSLPSTGDFSAGEIDRYRKLGASLPEVRTDFYRMVREAGEIISKTALLRVLGGNPFAKQWSGEPEWYTPPEYVESARRVMGGIDLDPASNPVANEKVRADVYFTAADNGLEQPWEGRVWLNPPYKMPAVRQFCDRLLEHVSSGEVSQAVILTNNATDTAWWHMLTALSGAVCFTSGRISFYNEDGQHSAPTNGQNFHYFGPRVEAFREEFSTHGMVMIRAA